MKTISIHLTDGKKVVLDAESQELNELMHATKTAIGGGDTGFISGWTTSDEWVLVPSRQIQGVTIGGFDRPS